MTFIYSAIDRTDAVNFLLPRHYSGRIPNIVCAFGVIDVDTNAIVAVCTFGIPASNSLCCSIGGEKYRQNVMELNRLCREEDYKKPLSQFVAWCLKQLKPRNIYVVSYSDTAMNHHGYIYQATNFLYTGCTKERTDIYVGVGRHSRHYKKSDFANRYRQKRFPKHRYVYICATTKNIKNMMLKDLRYPILPYPKGNNNKNYTLGNYLNDTLIDQSNGNEVVVEKKQLHNKECVQQTYLFLGEF